MFIGATRLQREWFERVGTEANENSNPQRRGSGHHASCWSTGPIAVSTSETCDRLRGPEAARDGHGQVRGIGFGHVGAAPVQVIVKETSIRHIRDEDYPPPRR